MNHHNKIDANKWICQYIVYLLFENQFLQWPPHEGSRKRSMHID
jgi:hypothetical protein